MVTPRLQGALISSNFYLAPVVRGLEVHDKPKSIIFNRRFTMGSLARNMEFQASGRMAHAVLVHVIDGAASLLREDRSPGLRKRPAAMMRSKSSPPVHSSISR